MESDQSVSVPFKFGTSEVSASTRRNAESEVPISHQNLISLLMNSSNSQLNLIDYLKHLPRDCDPSVSRIIGDLINVLRQKPADDINPSDLMPSSSAANINNSNVTLNLMATLSNLQPLQVDVRASSLSNQPQLSSPTNSLVTSPTIDVGSEANLQSNTLPEPFWRNVAEAAGNDAPSWLSDADANALKAAAAQKVMAYFWCNF